MDNNLFNLVDNQNLTYEELELFINNLEYNDLIIQNNYGNTLLMFLCLNISLTYEMIDLIVKTNYRNNALSYLCWNMYINFEILNPEELYKQNNGGKNPLTYLTTNESIVDKIEYYKLFITQYINMDQFIDIIGIEEYFEIINSH